MASGGQEVAYPVSPPPDLRAEDGLLSYDAIDALAEDMPGRLRAEFIQDATKHGRTTLTDAEEPARKHMRTETDVENSDTGHVFPLGWSDTWDLDDAQLYSEESLLLTSEAPPSSPVPAPDTLRKPDTSAQILINFLSALFAEQDECGPDAPSLAMVHNVQGEAALNTSALSQLHGILALCVRDTNKYLVHGLVCQDDTPYHLLDVDPQALARLLSLLDVTMRENIRDWSSSKDMPSQITDVHRSTQALLCAKCCLSIFSIDQLPKFLFSEELVAQCLNAIKPALEVFVLPLIEACAGLESQDLATMLLNGRIDNSTVQALDLHIHTLSACLGLLDTMFTLPNISMPDNLTIRCVYLALAPFFSHDRRVAPSKSSASCSYTHAEALKPFRLAGLNLLRSLFANYPSQRSWVLGEILVSLLRLPDLRRRKRQYRVGEGHYVYVLTALLLQLIQAASHQTSAAMELTAAWFNGESELEKPPCQINQESVHALASSVAKYLVQKGGETKMTKSAVDTSYGAIVYGLMEDLLFLLFHPEWPAAPILLSCFCRAFKSTLFDSKSSTDAKLVAVDQLGLVGARLRKVELELELKRKRLTLQPMRQIAKTVDLEGLEDIDRAYHSVMTQLRQGHKNPGMKTARTFYSAQYLYELSLARALSQSHEQFCKALTTCVDRVANTEAVRIYADVVPQLVLQSTFFIQFPSVVKALLQYCHAHALSLRTRTMRAIGNIAAVDAELLDDVRIREAVAAHLSDQSASVRETCVTILAAYVLKNKQTIPVFLPRISERCNDTASSVRRRALKFLKQVYETTSDHSLELHAALRLLRYLYDVDLQNQQAAQEALEDLWFGVYRTKDAQSVAHVLADVCMRIHERPSPLDEFLKRLGTVRESSSFAVQLGEFIDELLQDLFAAPVLSSAMYGRLRAVQILSAVHPELLTVPRAKQLLPYVDGAQSPDEVAVMEELLRIFAQCMPALPRTARSFAIHLETILTRLISKCQLRPGSAALEALVLCFCAGIQYQTHNYSLLARMYTSCLSLSRESLVGSPSLDAKGSLALCITGLLCAHGPWSESKLDNQVDSLFDMLMRFYTLSNQSTTDVDGSHSVLLALSYVLQAHPLKFLEPDVCKVMDQVFAHGSSLERYFMLRALWGYLERDATAPQGDVHMDIKQQLTGQVKVDAGVASALIQRYAEPILQATLEVDDPKTQQMASEMVKLSVLQGLSHPMQCIPYLVALETGDDPLLRHKAVQLHRHLLRKHLSMISTRFGESIMMAFRFQQRRTTAPRGVRSGTKREAVMQVWYDLLVEHRQAKLQFLRALVRLLDVSQDVSPTLDEVNLSVFVADTLQVLEYRCAEEPLTIIHELKMLDASTGIQVASIIRRRFRREEHLREPSPLTDEEDEEDDEAEVVTTDTPTDQKANSGNPLRSANLLSLVHAAKRVEILRYVRRSLKRMYCISEARCAKFEPGKRTALGDRPVVPVSEAVLCDGTIGLPVNDQEALAFLEDFIDAEDDIGSESELEYE